MKRLNEYAKRWTKRTPAAWALRAVVILVVPGALWIWIGWCLLRAMHTNRSQADLHPR